MKILKIVGAAFVAIVALLVIAALVIAWTFDPNAYKGYLADWVQQRTGREFRIEQDLELSFFPWLAVETGGIVLGNADGFGDDPFLSAERVEIRVKLMPLLRRQLEVGTVILDGLALNLATSADGRNNWEDLIASAEPAPGDDAPDAPADAAVSIDSLDVEGFRVRNGRMTWREDITELRYELSDLNVASGPIAIGEPIDLEIGFSARDVVADHGVRLSGRGTAEIRSAAAVAASNVQLDFHFADRTHPDRATGRLELARFERSDDGVIVLGDTALTGTLRAIADAPPELDVAVRFAAATIGPGGASLSVEELRTETAGISAAWQLDVAGDITAPTVRGTLAVAEAPLARVHALLNQPLPPGTTAASLGNLALNTGFVFEAETNRLALQNLDLRALGATVHGELSSEAFNRFRGRLDIAEFTPGAAVHGMLSAHLPDDVDVTAFRELGLSANFDTDLAAGRTTLRDVRASLLGGTLTGQLDITPSGRGQVIRGEIETSQLRPDQFASAFPHWLPEGLQPGELGMLRVSTRFVMDTAADTMMLDPLRLEAFGLSGSGRVSGSAISGAAVWTGNAEVQPFAPGDLLNRFALPAPETADPGALTRTSARANFRATMDSVRFENLELTIDDSRITGNLAIVGFDDPTYTFALVIDQVDADRYLPPRASEVEDGEMTAGDLELEVEAFNTMRLAGSLEVGSLSLAGMQFQQVATNMEIGDGRARLYDARARLYGGEFNGSFGVDTTGNVPTMTLSGRASNLAMRPLIVALTGDANLRGTGGFELDLAGRGAKISDNVATAQGRMNFSLRDGAIEGFNLGRGMCVAYNVLQRAPAPPSNLPRETLYELIQGSAEVRDGVAYMSDLLGRASFLTVNGNGRLVMTEQYLDYQLEARLSGPLGIPNCETMDGLIGESIPLRVRGVVTDPEIAPDYSAILERALRREAERRITDRLQDLIRSR